MKLADITPAPFPVRSGMGEHGLAYVTIKNQEARAPWGGDDDQFGVLHWRTVDHIIDLRAHGLTERDVIRRVREYVAEWFESGCAPKAFGNLAVRTLAHIEDSYPIVGENCFCSLVCKFERECDAKKAKKLINDAVKKRFIKKRLGGYGFEYRLTHEPRTRAVCDLLERVTAMMSRHPFGIPINVVRKIAIRLEGDVKDRGMVLTERALNAEVIFAKEISHIVIAHKQKSERTQK